MSNHSSVFPSFAFESLFLYEEDDDNGKKGFPETGRKRKWQQKFNTGHSVSKIKMDLRSSGTVTHFKKPESSPVGSTDDSLPTFQSSLPYYTTVSEYFVCTSEIPAYIIPLLQCLLQDKSLC